MNYNVRNFKESDYVMLHKWNAAYGELGPTKDMIPEESSFVLEIDSTPALFISVLCTNNKYAYLENYCGNPEFKGMRAEAVQEFIRHLENFAKGKGYKMLVTFAYKPKLITQFEGYGFTKTVSGMSAFVRKI